MMKRIALITLIAMLVSGIAYADDIPLPLTPHQIQRLSQLMDVHSYSSSEESVEHVVWQRAPIDVVLPVGKERQVSFSDSVSLGYDTQILPNSLLFVQNNNGTLYLTAKSAFKPERVQVKCVSTGEIILLNLSAQVGVSDVPLQVVWNEQASATSAESTFPVGQQETMQTIDPVGLTRFSVQQLYAPSRLLTMNPAIVRIPMHTKKTVSLLLDGSIIAMPLASWRSGDLTVTAVLLRNQLKQSLTLDPRTLCGDWKTVTFFPRTILSPTGQLKDSTTVFLVASRGFSESLQAGLRGF